MKVLRGAGVAALLTLMMSGLLAVGAAAKESQNYGHLTIQMTGDGGTQRTFLAASSEEQQAANYLVTQLGMVTEPTTISAPPPSLSQHYQIVVRQEPGAGALLPWSAYSSAEFYYYPGRGTTPAYVRCRIGRGSQPDLEAWLIAFPAGQSLIEPHLAGLAPIETAPAVLRLKAATANPPATANLPAIAMAVTLILAAAVVTWVFLRRSRLAAATVAGLSLVAVVVVAAGAGEHPPTRQQVACGRYPSIAPIPPAIPTPHVASPPPGSTSALAPRVAVVGAWAGCFRPEVVNISVGDLVQWQQIDSYSPVVTLENGLELGSVRHILEVRFNRPGRYAYHAKSEPAVLGTIVVEGQARSAPELEVWSEGQHRALSQATALADGCAVTLPTGSTPPGVGVGVSGVNYGNGKVWVSLYPEGRVDAGPHYVQPDGSIGMKFGWWRGVHGKLVITGRRLDAGAPSARSSVPDGYGDLGFQASGITFPTPGCWEITGTVGNASLTFVTMVVRA